MFSAHPDSEGAFYAVLSHNVMAASFGAVALFVVLAFVMGFLRLWHDIGERSANFLEPECVGHAIHDALRLKYLEGGGHRRTYPDEKFSQVRRRYHHMTFYGFLLCFAAASVATVLSLRFSDGRRPMHSGVCRSFSARSAASD